MQTKILITGPPRSGKSTLISRVLDHFRKENLTISGFLTPEVGKNERRIGFDILDIPSGERVALARKGDFDTPHHLGSYALFMDAFESFLEFKIIPEYQNTEVILIDEIGKMELRSPLFERLIREIFTGETPVIATIGLNLRHPIKEEILQQSNVIQYRLDRSNFEEIFTEILNRMV